METPCAGALLAGSSRCEVAIRLAPQSQGPKVASLVVSGRGSSQDLMLWASLQGTGALGPDLSGSWLKLRQVCKGSEPGQKCRLVGKLFIANQGQMDVKSKTRLDFYLCNDAIWDVGDRLLKTGSLGKLKAGKSKSKRFHKKLPSGESASSLYVIAVLDSQGAIEEYRRGEQ